jgi:hypothetical protein
VTSATILAFRIVATEANYQAMAAKEPAVKEAYRRMAAFAKEQEAEQRKALKDTSGTDLIAT